MLILDSDHQQQIADLLRARKCKQLKLAFVSLKQFLLTRQDTLRHALEILDDSIHVTDLDCIFNPNTCDGDYIIAQYLTTEQVFKWCEGYAKYLKREKHANIG